MNIIKKFESFLGTQEKIEPIAISNSKILIESEAYDVSQFGQKKFGVYIETETGVYYYIGDIREFSKSNDSRSPYMSYINLDSVSKRNPTYSLVKLNGEQMDLIDKELNRLHLTNSLLDDDITQKDILKRDLNIIL